MDKNKKPSLLAFDISEKYHFEDDFPITPTPIANPTPSEIKETYNLASPSSPNRGILSDFSSDSIFSQFGGNFASFVFSSLFSHPLIVLRRQCQANVDAQRYHIQPFSLLPVVMGLQSQGAYTMWKGSTSDLLVRLIGQVTETIVCNATGLPKEVDYLSISMYSLKHILLKSISFTILTPFYCEALIKTVQNDIDNDIGSVDFLKESFTRFLGFRSQSSTSALPIWKLALPTAAYFTGHYIISSVVTCLTNKILLSKKKDKTSNTMRIFYLFSSGIIGHLVADAILYPCETVLNRLFLQGTRTIIDNLDTGTSVISINTHYEGPFDCFNSIVESEGAAGLFKGFGALMVQAAINISLIKISAHIFKKFDSSS